MAKWVKAKFETENKSFTAIANKIAGVIAQPEIKKTLIDGMMEDFKKKYNAKNLQVLSDNAWKALQGTESWNAETMKMIERNIKRNDIPLLNQSIIDLLMERPVAAPIIMMQKNIGMLISGEHTLMACKLLNIEPKVVIIQ